jgi:ABC-2 type transport system permease protein
MTIPVATATAREQKLLRRFQATPLPPLVYIAADVAVYLSIAVAGMAALVIVSSIAFGLRLGGSWGAVAAAFLFAALAFIAIGYVIASLASTSRVAQVIGQIVYFPMMFLSGAAIPLAFMPPHVQQFAEWLPLTHAVHLFQGLWFGGGWDATALLVLAGVLVVGVLISAKVFRWE